MILGFEKISWEFLATSIVAPLTAYLWYWKNKNEKDAIDDDRFHTSITDLGSNSVPIRLGAIFILENMAHDNPLRSPNIIEILCAFLKSNYLRNRKKEKFSSENKLCIDIISRLWGMYYRYWDFSINGEPDLRNINLMSYELWSVDLHGFFLEKANFNNCYLEKANLSKAKLAFATFSGANLRFTDLSDAEIFAADLKNSKNLTQDQVELSLGCIGTQLPKNLIRPKKWTNQCRFLDFCTNKDCDSLLLYTKNRI